MNIKWYHAEQDLMRFEEIIDRIQLKPVDLIYVFGTIATQAILKKIKRIPVVFSIVNRPVAAGIIKSWEHSGNNATGASNQVPVESRLKAFKKVVKLAQDPMKYTAKNLKLCSKQRFMVLLNFS